MTDTLFLTTETFEAGLDVIRNSPKDNGPLQMIVRRPRENVREVLGVGQLDLIEGLIGDYWRIAGSSSTPDGAAHPDAQITLMNARAIALVAGHRERWPLAGDQLYVDLDLSNSNLPPGMRLAIGEAIVEITAKPHTGCGSFMQRYGRDATKFVNSRVGRELNLRGVNAKVIRPGVVRVGDLVKKLQGETGAESASEETVREITNQ